MDVLKPLKAQPLTFWFSGGELFWLGRGPDGSRRPQPIDDAQVDGMLGIYFDEIKAALMARDSTAADAAQSLFKQLYEARTALRRWRQLFNGERREALAEILIQTSRKAA